MKKIILSIIFVIGLGHADFTTNLSDYKGIEDRTNSLSLTNIVLYSKVNIKDYSTFEYIKADDSSNAMAMKTSLYDNNTKEKIFTDKDDMGIFLWDDKILFMTIWQTTKQMKLHFVNEEYYYDYNEKIFLSEDKSFKVSIKEYKNKILKIEVQVKNLVYVFNMDKDSYSIQTKN